MEKFRSHYEEIQRGIRIKNALELMDGYFFNSSEPKRLISGIALSSRNRNSKGSAFYAQGMESTLPCPLLLEHDWGQAPLGRVIALEVCGDVLKFRAEIGNRGNWKHVEAAWLDVIGGIMTGVSVQADSIDSATPDSTFVSWRLDEISLVRSAADRGARITRCAERLPHVRLDGPSETVYWSVTQYLHRPDEIVYGSAP